MMVHSVKIVTSLLYPSFLLLHLIHSIKIAPALTDYGDSTTRQIPLRNIFTNHGILSRYCSDQFEPERGENSSIFRYCYLPENFQEPEIQKWSAQKIALKLNLGFITTQDSQLLPCLCTIPGHCFGQQPYYPNFGLIELENFAIPSKTDSKNKSLPLEKVLNSTGFLELAVSLVAPNSTCGDYVIWVIVRSPEFILLQICGTPYMCNKNQTPYFKYLLSKRRQEHEPELMNISSLVINSKQPTDPYKIVGSKLGNISKNLQLLIKSQQWNKENFPNPRTNHTLCNARSNKSSVCDPDHILSRSEVDLLEERIFNISFSYICFCLDVRNCTRRPSGPKIGVALAAESLKGNNQGPEKISGSVKMLADGLRLRWDFGQCEDFVLIMYSVKDEYLFVSMGKSVEMKLTHKFTHDLLNNVSPLVVKGRVFEALTQTLTALEDGFVDYMQDRARYLLFIQILLVTLVVLTPFACLMGLAFTK